MKAVTSNRFPILAEEILFQHTAAKRSGEAFVRHAIEAGRRLNEARELIPRGEFELWVSANVPGLSVRMCQRYMKAAKVVGSQGDTVSLSSLRALVAPSKPRTSQPYDENLWPDPAPYLPPDANTLRSGWRSNPDGSSDAIFIAPSAKYPGYFFVIHLWSAPEDHRDGGFVNSFKKEIRAAGVGFVIEQWLSQVRDGMEWHNTPLPGGLTENPFVIGARSNDAALHRWLDERDAKGRQS